jgi:hypothetical protein
VDPVPDPLLLRKNLVAPGIEPGPLNLTTEAVSVKYAIMQNAKREKGIKFHVKYYEHSLHNQKKTIWCALRHQTILMCLHMEKLKKYWIIGRYWFPKQQVYFNEI